MIRVEDLSKQFTVEHNLLGKPVQWLTAVADLNFTIREGETLALVGESGSGKSTTARMILNLLPPSKGKIFWKESELTGRTSRRLRPFRRKMQVVFQDPYSSLNPRMSIESILKEPYRIHRKELKWSGAEVNQRIHKLLDQVGVPSSALYRYPHEFSGGQRQRIGIARALTLEPEFLVLDEPVSSLDVSVQAQILNLLQQIKKDRGLTYLFIAHDLALVNLLADTTAIMYLGEIVEFGPTRMLFGRPKHPYTEALLASVPRRHPGQKAAQVLPGEIPSPINPPPGCPFHPRCPLAQEVCRNETPPIKREGERWFTCHLR